MRPRFFVPEATGDRARLALPADEAHHLRRVLRLGEGAEVAIFDGRGHEWAARVAEVGPRASVTVELAHAIAPPVEPPVHLTLAIGILKGDQMEAVVRDATALGVAAIAPFSSDHVAVSPRMWRGETVVARWRRVAVASAKQCGRAVVPAIAPVAPFSSAIETDGDVLRVMCVEPARTGARPLTIEGLTRPARAVAFVGPEGGWSAGEIDVAIRRGVRLVHLGPRTLRAETAPTVLLSALWTMWGW